MPQFEIAFTYAVVEADRVTVEAATQEEALAQFPKVFEDDLQNENEYLETFYVAALMSDDGLVEIEEYEDNDRDPVDLTGCSKPCCQEVN